MAFAINSMARVNVSKAIRVTIVSPNALAMFMVWIARSRANVRMEENAITSLENAHVRQASLDHCVKIRVQMAHTAKNVSKNANVKTKANAIHKMACVIVRLVGQAKCVQIVVRLATLAVNAKRFARVTTEPVVITSVASVNVHQDSLERNVWTFVRHTFSVWIARNRANAKTTLVAIISMVRACALMAGRANFVKNAFVQTISMGRHATKHANANGIIQMFVIRGLESVIVRMVGAAHCAIDRVRF